MAAPRGKSSVFSSAPGKGSVKAPARLAFGMGNGLTRGSGFTVLGFRFWVRGPVRAPSPVLPSPVTWVVRRFCLTPCL